MDTDARNSLPAPEVLPGLPQFVDLKTLHRATTLAEVTWRGYERTGRIRGYRIGGRLLFAVADVLEFLSRQSPRRTPPPQLLESSGRYRRRRRRTA